MEPDALGFLYPKVDESRCVDCGLCEKVCQFNDSYDCSLNLPQPIVYAARHKNIDEVMRSRSGAAFVAISDYILEQGGVVYGAGYKDHFRVVHKRATTKEQRDEFRGSKYVQSDLTGVFQQVKEDLRNGLQVLFSGTPCQTSGLNAYVGKRLRRKLFLVDIVCHGVPGPYIWQDYLAYLEKKHGSRVTYVNFRDKEQYGWKAHKESFKFENEEGKMDFTYFTCLFYQHIMLRHSCGVCHFANIRRPSDITLADFWGWENNVPEFNADNKGISLVLLNTDWGRDIFVRANQSLIIKEVDMKNCFQTNLLHPTRVHPLRKTFEDEYCKYGIKYILIKYSSKSNKISRRLKCYLIKTKKLIKK